MTNVESRSDDLASQLDQHSDYFRENVYDIYGELRQQCPMVHSEKWGGFWAFLDYDDVYDAEQVAEIFSSGAGKEVPGVPGSIPFIPIDYDPPLVQDYRKIALPFFSPGAAKALEPTFRRLATELIDEFIETGEADIIGQLTTPLPARWILQMLGFDETRWRDWVEWIHGTVHELATNPEKSAAAAGQIYLNITTEIAKRRAEGFGDDLLSTLMQGEVNDMPLDDGQVLGYAFLMLLGGMDTTSGLTGNALVRLEEQPELRERLIRDPAVLPKATEEFLRHDTPTQGLPRIVAKDCEFKGQQFSAGERVLLMFAAANRDPKVFEDPDRIDFDRAGNRHLAFGAGPHRCMGSNHARVMFQVMMSEILTRLPDYTISGEIERFDDAGSVYAVRRLPIRFTPGPRLLGK
ncbi:cytochrome P450 [soil metagenome]